ncbi:MAG TPA: 2-dehydropantoate 2-reductase [Chthoniobacterales bacterium]
MKIAIVGSGAIGCYYGARLLVSGEDVRFLMRSDLGTVREKGLQIRSPDGDLNLTQVPAYGTTSEIGLADLVLVTLKTTSNDALKTLIPPLLGRQTILLTLQNGLGNEEFLAEHFEPEHVTGGLCFVCLTRTAPGFIEHYGHGRIAIGEMSGPPSDRVRDIVARFSKAGIDCHAVDDLPLARWRKLVWNIPFNGLSIAAGKATVEDLLADRYLRIEVGEIMREVISLANALGHPLSAGKIVDPEIARSENMGPYRPSSLIDFERGLPVEVESIWGEPVRLARKIGHPVPRIELLYALLRRLAA